MSSAENKAVFLSYASQDAEAARRICDALRAAGVEVWFDQSELRGGDAWDAKIRKQIRECALFVPVISANTQARLEGYFRLEWKLAAQRTHTMADAKPFLVPVCIDDTRDGEAHVPEEFRAVQWMRTGGDASVAFCTRVKVLLKGDSPPPLRRNERPIPGEEAASGRPLPRGRLGSGIVVAVLVGALGVAGYFWQHRGPVATPFTAKEPGTEAQRLIAKIGIIVDKDADATRDEWALADTMGAEAVRLEPANPAAWGAYADAALGVYRFYYDRATFPLADALKRAQHALTLAADSTDAKLALARCYIEDSRTRQEADKILRSLLSERPQDRRVLRSLAALLRLRTRDQSRDVPANALEESIELCRRAGALPGGDPVALRQEAEVLGAIGRYNEADAALERSLALRAGPAAHVLKIWIELAGRQDVERACASVAKLPGSYFLREDVNYVAALAWLWKRDPDKCLGVLKGWHEDFLMATPKAYLAGQAYQLQQRFDAAESAWRSALTVVEKQRTAAAGLPQEDELSWWRARLLAGLGDRSSAEEIARSWRQAHPSRRNIQYAALLVALGKTEEAVEALPHRLTLGVGWLTALRTGAAELRFDPVWDPLRGDPRFQALLAGFEQTLPVGKRDRSGGTGSDRPDLNAAPPEKSVAVLAFENLSEDKANEYFSDGISEELINTLGRVPGLTVKGRTSAFYFKDKKNLSSAEIAHQLGVAYLVRGGVRKFGGKVRITAELTRAATDELVWSSDPLDRKADDPFAVQEEIAALIAKNLQLKLGTASSGARTVNAEAFQLYLQSRSRWSVSDAGNLEAERFLVQALAVDPNFARAHAGLSDVWRYRGQTERTIGKWSQRDGTVIRRMTDSAQRAVQLDPSLAEGRQALGMAYWMAWRFEEAEKELRTAVALNPNYAWGHHGLGRVFLVEGKVDESVAALRRAVELDPLSSRMADNFAMALRCADRLDEALSQIERALALDPENDQALSQKAIILAELGRNAEAAAANEAVIRSGVRFTESGVAFALLGRHEEAEQVLERIKTTDQRGGRATILAALGRWGGCLDALETDSAPVAHGLHTFFYGAQFDPVRSDPRFLAVLRQQGVKEAHDRAQAWRAKHPPEKPAANR